VFIKAGAIIRNILFNNMGELEFDELTLDLYYKEGKGEVVYEDAQDGYDYKR
jgi:alpha-glucosidase